MSVSRKNSGLFSNNLSDKNFIDQVVKRAEAIYTDYEVSKSVKLNSNKPFVYDAQLIAGTHLIAGCGPHQSGDDGIESFIKNILLNDDLGIEKIITLGGDFVDYFSGKNNKRMFGQYQLVARIKSGDLKQVEFVKSEVTICDTTTQKLKHVDVTVLPVYGDDLNCDTEADDDSLDFIRMPLDDRLEELWNLYQETQRKNIMIHCTSGRGRTGIAVLMFELMREYDKVFASGNPDMIAKEAHAVLTRIQQSRDVLLTHNDYGFCAAIRSVYYLHRYGLQKTAELQADANKIQMN